MVISSTTYHRNQPFDEYLKMPGKSFSTIKNDGVPITPSEGMRLGTRVHNYLLEPDKYDWQMADVVKPIAAAIRTVLGSALYHLESEVGFTSEFTHNGLTMLYKGRADLLKPGKIVVDLKVLAGSLDAAIKRFGYVDQLSGYCIATGSPIGLIVAYNKHTKKVETKLINPLPAYWEYQVVRWGE